jgi:lipoate-protein ligase B
MCAGWALACVSWSAASSRPDRAARQLRRQAAAKPDAPGVYVDGAKIASLGLRIRNGCSFHGLALNVDMDLAPFRRINPAAMRGWR